jgi:hypothetical protein
MMLGMKMAVPRGSSCIVVVHQEPRLTGGLGGSLRRKSRTGAVMPPSGRLM